MSLGLGELHEALRELRMSFAAEQVTAAVRLPGGDLITVSLDSAERVEIERRGRDGEVTSIAARAI